MSWSDGPLLGFDLETDGTDPLTCHPVSFALVRWDQGVAINVRHALINPGRPIPPECTEIHGITDAMVQEKGGELERQVVGIAGVLIEADCAGVPIVTMNGRFDLTIIDSCLRRMEGGEGLRDMSWGGGVIDVSVIDRKQDKWRKGGRKLSDLCATYGVDPGRSHSAVDDVLATIKVWLALVKKWPWLGTGSLEDLHLQQIKWRQDWAVDFSEYLVKKGEPPLAPEEAHWPLATDTVALPPTAIVSEAQEEPQAPLPPTEEELAAELRASTEATVKAMKAPEVRRLLKRWEDYALTMLGKVFPGAELEVEGKPTLAEEHAALVEILVDARANHNEEALNLF